MTYLYFIQIYLYFISMSPLEIEIDSGMALMLYRQQVII